MSLKSLLVGASVAGFVFFTPTLANASDVQSGTVAAGYSLGLNKGLSDVYGINGTLTLPFSEDSHSDQIGVELDGGYHRPTDGSWDIFNLGGAAFASGSLGRAALGTHFIRVDNADIGTFGLGGEWYASERLSLALRGGGIVWKHNDGGYAGGQATFYATPNFAVSGTLDYWSASYNQYVETVRAEWMPFERPIAFYAGYQHEDSRGISDSTVFVGVKVYLDGKGQESLAGYQRHTSSGFIATAPNILGDF